jgi:hypothetical protein
MSDDSPPRIERFRFGRVVIDGKVFQRDLIVFPGGVKENWSREDSHLLLPDDLDPLIEMASKTLIIGTGVFRLMKVPGVTLSRAEAAGIKLLVLVSSQACDEYNRCRLKERTVLAMHLNC